MSLEGISVPILLGTQSCRPLSLHTVGMEMQDSRVTRGKTNWNQFALEFHPRGIS